MSLVLGLGLEHSCPWPREDLSLERLSLASDFFCVLGLGLEPCVLDSTSGPKISFYPNQTTLGRDEVFFVFSFFSLFFLFFPFSFQILSALLLLNHKKSKYNFCVKLLICKHNFVPKLFGPLLWDLPQNEAKKLIF